MKKVTRLHRKSFGWSSSFGENANNSLAAWNILFKFCILLYFNIVQTLVCETGTRLHRASIWPAKLLVKMLKTVGPHGVF